MEQRSIRTPRLEVAYLELGPADGAPVLALHGFPDDATAWRDVMQLLAASGRRVIAPFVRGCGATRFLDAATPRAGDFAALGQDAVDVVDALELDGLTVVGQDWGSPTAEIVAIERPERVARLVKLNWFGIYTAAEMAKAPGFAYRQLAALWYAWMFNLPLGEAVLRRDRSGIAAELWRQWSPSWDAATRDAAVRSVLDSFAADDWMRVVLSFYRTDLRDDVERDPRDDRLRATVKQPPPVGCPTSIVKGADDGVERTPLDANALRRFFPAGVDVRTLPGIGHFPHREAPGEVVRAILQPDRAPA